MDFVRLDALAKQYMGHRKSHLEREIGHVYFHGKRVAKSVVLLREKLFPEDGSHDDILRCAGLFHDLGKGIEPHDRTGTALARELLREELTASELEEVCGLILAHNDRTPKGGSHSCWVQLLQDADLLDHFGSQGVWLSFIFYAYAGQKGIEDLIQFYDAEWERPIPHYRSSLNFDLSRSIFDEKIAYERSVIRRLRLESDGSFL